MEGIEGWTMIAQGAEAKVWKGQFFGRPCIMKERIPKLYRHPSLEASLSKKRLNQVLPIRLKWTLSDVDVTIICVYRLFVLFRYLLPFIYSPLRFCYTFSLRSSDQEARCLLRARKSGVCVPCVYHLDHDRKVLNSMCNADSRNRPVRPVICADGSWVCFAFCTASHYETCSTYRSILS